MLSDIYKKLMKIVFKEKLSNFYNLLQPIEVLFFMLLNDNAVLV